MIVITKKQLKRYIDNAVKRQVKRHFVDIDKSMLKEAKEGAIKRLKKILTPIEKFDPNGENPKRIKRAINALLNGKFSSAFNFINDINFYDLLRSLKTKEEVSELKKNILKLNLDLGTAALVVGRLAGRFTEKETPLNVRN